MERRHLADQGGSETRRGQRTGPQTSGSLYPTSMLGQMSHMSNLYLLLLGKSCSGKSATGNTILGKPVFKTKSCGQMVTKTCQRETGFLNKKEVVVIDTPDLFSSKVCPEEKNYNIQHCLDLSTPTLHVLLLVIRIGHYTREDKETVRGIQDVFGPEAWRYTIIVFTQKDDLGDDLLEDYIDNDKSLKELVQRCEHRYCAFNNKAGEDQRTTQVSELLYKIENLVVKNEGPYQVNFKMEGSRFQNCENEAVPQKKGHPHEALSIILVGRSGNGKSATGNTILKHNTFLSRLQAQSVTMVCQSSRTTWNEQDVVVVDTPFFNQMPGAERDPSWLEEEVKRCWSFCEEGTKTFVLVFQLGRFTEEDKAVVVELEATFGKEVMSHSIVLFTRMEDLTDGTLENYIKNTNNKALKKIIEKCEMRCCGFKNKETGPAGETQVKILLEIANDLRRLHNGKGYPHTWEHVHKQIKHAQEKSTFKKFRKNLKV